MIKPKSPQLPIDLALTQFTHPPIPAPPAEDQCHFFIFPVQIVGRLKIVHLIKFKIQFNKFNNFGRIKNKMATLDEKFQAAVDIVQKLPKEGKKIQKINFFLNIFIKNCLNSTETFKKISHFQGPLQSSNDQKLKFYSLYKQATIGNVNTERPGFFSLVERKKWSFHKFLNFFKIPAGTPGRRWRAWVPTRPRTSTLRHCWRCSTMLGNKLDHEKKNIF